MDFTSTLIYPKQRQTSSSMMLSLSSRNGIDRYFFNDDSLSHTVHQEKVRTKENTISLNFVKKDVLEIYSISPIAGLVSGDTSLECYYSESQKAFYFIETNIRNGISNACDTFALDNNENFIAAMEQSNKIYIFAYVEKSNSLWIFVKEPGKELQEIEKVIDIPEKIARKKSYLKNNNTGKLANFFDGKDEFVFLQNDVAYPLLYTSRRKKIYAVPGNLIMSIENQDLQTNIMKLNLDDYSYQLSSFQTQLTPGDSQKDLLSTSNSYIKDSLIYKTGVTIKNFYFSIHNLYTGELVKSIQYPNKDNDSLFGTSLIKTGNFFSAQKQRSVNINRMLVAAFKGKNIGISLHPINDTSSELTLGSIYTQVSLKMVGLSIAISALGTYGINAIPSLSGFLLTSFYDISASNTIAVNIQLNRRTFEFESLNNTLDKADIWTNKVASMRKFTNDINLNSTKRVYAMMDKNLYVGFLDINSRKYYLYKF